MKNRITYGLLALLLLLISNPISAAQWEAKAKSLFEKDEYHKVIDIAEEHKKDKDSKLGLMLLAFSHLQLYEFNGTSSDKKAFKNYMEILEDYITVEHLDDIGFFIKQTDKPEVVDEARDLLEEAFDNIRDTNDVPLIVPFARANDKKTRKLAIGALEDIISVKRKYVKKGGTLRNKDIAVMQDGKLIRALLDNIDISGADDALEDIEEPVLAYLKDYEGKKIQKLEKNILEAIQDRQEDYPDSTWYSAIGKDRKAAK